MRRLPWSHAISYHLKAWLRGTFRGVSAKHLPRHLDEFAYRFSHRARDAELAGLILQRALAAPPLTYRRWWSEVHRCKLTCPQNAAPLGPVRRPSTRGPVLSVFAASEGLYQRGVSKTAAAVSSYSRTRTQGVLKAPSPSRAPASNQRTERSPWLGERRRLGIDK